jgi:hypothetical protein
MIYLLSFLYLYIRHFFFGEKRIITNKFLRVRIEQGDLASIDQSMGSGVPRPFLPLGGGE